MTESSRISHTLPKGFQFDDFEIEEVLGIGGFGITYCARDIHLNRSVAIKEYMPSGMAIRDKEHATVFPASDSHKDDFEWGLDRFRKEAETLVSFRHPNIVSVFRFFMANGTAYLVMEYQDGKSLADILGANGTLSEPEIEEILDPLLEGLEQVHESGFMHRDIKPANLFIRRDGKPVLIDFGAARQALSGHSQALTSIVTAGYAPYEQYETDSIQGPWSDIYALGATLYRAVTGQRPVEAPKRAGCVMRGEPDPNKPAVKAAKGKYSTRLLEAIDAALNVLEGQRPQSVAEFRNYLKGTPKAEAATAVTGSDTTGEGATLYVGGGQTAATAPGAPVGGAQAAPRSGSPPTVERAGGPVSPQGPPEGPSQTPPPSQAPSQVPSQVEARKSSGKGWIWALVGVGAFLVVGGAAAGVFVYVEDQRTSDEAARKEAARKAALEAKRRAEELEAKRKAALEAERKKREELEKKKAELKDPDGRDPDTKPPERTPTRPDDPTPDAPTVGEPGGLVGRWCSPRSQITFSTKSMSIRNLDSNWTRTYHVDRYDVQPTVVTIHFTGSGNVGKGIFVFNRQRHSTIKMTLRRVFAGQRWRSSSTYFSRSC